MGNRYIVFAFTLAAAWLLPAAGLHAQTPEAGDDTVAAASVSFDIPAGPMAEALTRFSEQSGVQLMYQPSLVEGLEVTGFQGAAAPVDVLQTLIDGAGLTWTRVNGNTVALQVSNGASAGQRRSGIEEIIVTGQKREERIQDVPIAISAFSMKDLEAQKLEGGFDLVKAIPNVSFSKTNFTSYNFQIRGVGTQSISATSDPGVAVAFNNSAIIQNRLFEQEYLDVERVEVLRGPQGTLYGRNATAGVINVISNKPELGVWDGMLDVEVGNYNTRRLRGHFNMPIGDTWALRGAYASTDREGYTFNSGTGSQVDGRDLWTGRLTLGWQPNDRLRADLIYERFEEDDDRLRTGKQLCHRDDGPEKVGDVFLADDAEGPNESLGVNSLEEAIALRRAVFGQGCKPGSLYTDGAFNTPNGLSYNFVLGTRFAPNLGNRLGELPGSGPGGRRWAQILEGANPYGDLRQSRDLREIFSPRDPAYRAEADLFELNIDFDLTDALTFTSQTAYVEDETYSFQDFNRFASLPIFTDTSQIIQGSLSADFSGLAPGGVFCDPQVGCSDRMAGFDIAQASAEQFNQEFRLQSAFAGPLNFSVGANYTEFETLVDYFVMFNVISAMASAPIFDFNPDPDVCRTNFSFQSGNTFPADSLLAPCPFVDPNPVDTSRNFGTGGNNEGEGHNYFRSKNPYELESWAGFGEMYWNIQDDLKLTLGLRYTDDKKVFDQIPTQVLLSFGTLGGGTVARGYPQTGTIEQQWGEWTGRLVLDWQPILDFTDETLIYGSFSRGYKGGGANPPTPGFATLEDYRELLVESGIWSEFLFELSQTIGTGLLPVLELTAQEYGDTFEPEFVNAYEIGTKNTLFGGAIMLNATAFYYDYTDYQVSQIRDRTAVNENFDTEMWGLELETIFAPSPNWQFLANIGYLKTKIAEGETSIDIMNRTQGDPGYVLAKPWPARPSNCVVPVHIAEVWAQDFSPDNLGNVWRLCGGTGGIFATSGIIPDSVTGEGWDPLAVDDDGNLVYPEINGGAGLLADLGGNELPQSPRFTVTLGGQYSFDVTPEWRGTVRMDYYWQDDSYHRIYNTEPYDRLKSWSNTNLSFWVNNQNSGITVEAYVKNLFNQTPITGAFLNSDDIGLTTNVFMFDPRLIGVSVRKEW